MTFKRGVMHNGTQATDHLFASLLCERMIFEECVPLLQSSVSFCFCLLEEETLRKRAVVHFVPALKRLFFGQKYISIFLQVAKIEQL